VRQTHRSARRTQSPHRPGGLGRGGRRPDGLPRKGHRGPRTRSRRCPHPSRAALLKRGACAGGEGWPGRTLG
jgi:hypothetical protein